MLWTYDWLLMLPQEVKYIWRASWNWTKILYIFIRYLSFASLSLLIRTLVMAAELIVINIFPLDQFALGPTPDSCKKALQAACWAGILGMDLTEIVLAIRTYAVWNKDKRVGFGLALLLIACQIPNTIFVERFIEVINFIDNPFPETYRGCLAVSGTNIIYVNWVLFIILEGVVLVLMVISAMRTYRKNTSDFLNVIYLHGMRFYLYMFLVTVANILITVLMPIEFVGVGSSLEIVLHSNLACRLVIGIREASRVATHKLETFELSGARGSVSFTFAQADREGGLADLEACTEPPRS
ncbi:hypothetical protein BJ322DRAFT_815113 [Thelephora terrestris]|uniref:DUF6533 domain-containing protein n=1 Tax=Thelephora terrestris TaxID=56493 RepID=A0A9P6L764_9AGAM|nr:hypothetical protein BJ322DRAFT_815113 [Thelephora terrestris]